jgi:hypothetical protein
VRPYTMGATWLLALLCSLPGVPGGLGQTPDPLDESQPSPGDYGRLLIGGPEEVEPPLGGDDQIPEPTPASPSPEGQPPPTVEKPPVEAPSAAPAPSPAAAPARRPRSTAESTRYRVAWGVLGQLGEIEISFSSPGGIVRAVGVGRGSLLGIGKVEKRFESDVDPAAPGTPRWTASRVQGGKTVVDTFAQPTPGSIETTRRHTGKPDQSTKFVRGRPVLDPLGFLWRLRTRPPTTKESFEVLDGRALWIISVDPPRSAPFEGGRRALVLKGHAEPIFWDGDRDPERTAREFKIWLEDDAFRTPLRLSMPLMVGEVRVDLVRLRRPLVGTAVPRPRPAIEARAQALPGPP